MGTSDIANYSEMSHALTHARMQFTPSGGSPLEQTLVKTAIEAIRDDYLLEEFAWVIDGQNLSDRK